MLVCCEDGLEVLANNLSVKWLLKCYVPEHEIHLKELLLLDEAAQLPQRIHFPDLFNI